MNCQSHTRGKIGVLAAGSVNKKTPQQHRLPMEGGHTFCRGMALSIQNLSRLNYARKPREREDQLKIRDFAWTSQRRDLLLRFGFQG